MSTLDQCPSSAKEGKPLHRGRSPLATVGVSGQAYWRGLDDYADTPQFREMLEKEFPAGASELLEGSRRTFLKLMGASVALAGAATIPGCRRPDHTIMPFSKNVPEEIIPGKALYYATSTPLPGGGAEGLLVETHDGRPTKIEGNPLHPANKGKSSLWSQASVLDVYDPDRLTDPRYLSGGEYKAVTWDDFAAWCNKNIVDKFKASRGKGLAFVFEPGAGPTRDAQIADLRAKYSDALFVAYDALENANASRGNSLAFGTPKREILTLENARFIVALDRDFLSYEPGTLANARGFAAGRRPNGGFNYAEGKTDGPAKNDQLSRVYSVEAAFTLTGAAADHRLALPASQIPAFTVALAKAVLTKRPGPAFKPLTDALAAMADVPAQGELAVKFIEAIATDLLSDEARDTKGGRSLIVCGATQPAAVHALVAALNGALGNIGRTVSYLDEGRRPDAPSSAEQITALAKALAAGEVDTIVTIGVNPVFNAPAELDFAKAFAKAPNRVTLSVDSNETVAASTWRLPAAHYLESWGDTESLDGTVAPTQPMIQPLYGGKSAIELLAMIGGNAKPDGYEIVRARWRSVLKGDDFESRWSAALHDGLLQGSTRTPAAATPDYAAVAGAWAKFQWPKAPDKGALDVVFAVGVNHDGRFANNGWLQEIPEPASHTCWDNPAFVSPKTARELGLMQTAETDEHPSGRMADLTVGTLSMRIAVWAVPGLPDNTVLLHPGSGRTEVGLVGQGVGFNPFKVRTAANPWLATGGKLAPVTTGDTLYPISCTQTHGSMEGRAIVREIDLAAWHEHGDEDFLAMSAEDSYGEKRTLTMAESLEGSEVAHTPANVGIYPNPFNGTAGDPKPGTMVTDPKTGKLKPAAYSVGPQWGMSIDLSTCIGCNVCTVACQAENNIPVVGKVGVNEYREMSWIRVDRYFRGDNPDSTDGMVFQPLPCVHCENAPCETVCPVNATVHGEEGHNYMTYNRCIGTRYCANNCPYKVRRFNFFDYGVAKYQGSYHFQEAIEGVFPGDKKGRPHEFDPNLIPPRLRQKLDEISKMQKNPNVTVRSRGVMEKCSYCIQRTNEAKIEMKVRMARADKEGRRTDANGQPMKPWRPEDGMPDGFVQTACQQACPTDAIVFGDILDDKSQSSTLDGKPLKGSRARQLRSSNRSYMLLGLLNTRPRTTHMVRVNNPSPLLRKPVKDPFGPHGHHHHHDHDHDHGHEHDHDHGHEDKKKGAFVDPARRGRDGYVLSLAVLGGR